MEMLDQLALGKQSTYHSSYDPRLLFPMSRQKQREELGIVDSQLPFCGFDRWTHYEVSWLNRQGKPIVAIVEIAYPADSTNIVESKSMKLYFNSLNNTVFQSIDALTHTIREDISRAVNAEAAVNVTTLDMLPEIKLINSLEGECIDALDVSCSVYNVTPSLLSTSNQYVEETLFSNLLKANCLVTNQPDWGSVQIRYKGKKINRENLLQYIVSYRNHNEFHEQCVERMYMDILNTCSPEELIVDGRYTRRGGIDINPFRSSTDLYVYDNRRLCRQ